MTQASQAGLQGRHAQRLPQTVVDIRVPQLAALHDVSRVAFSRSEEPSMLAACVGNTVAVYSLDRCVPAADECLITAGLDCVVPMCCVRMLMLMQVLAWTCKPSAFHSACLLLHKHFLLGSADACKSAHLVCMHACMDESSLPRVCRMPSTGHLFP